MDNTKNAVEIFNKLADQYQHKFMNVDMYADTFAVFCNAIKKQNSEVLELACGPGNITKYLLKKRPDLKILGTDLSLNMVELAKLNNPEAEFRIMDCRDLLALNKKYDAIMCGFCLPYLSKEDALKLISDASKILTGHGVIYISTMEDDNSASGFEAGSTGDKIYMNYHEADYLIKALEENNFKVIELQRKHSPANATKKTTDLFIIAGKNEK
ncbi:MAG: class I SAM-dependent methyltransferase [Bacteroidetes bacterium]|nr:class I SAM-dependent methyltransferase [Bacteroidota bacterium]